MGTLMCPLCCDEEFSCQLSLKYHLLSITDNMYCPECSKRFDSILQLANHLDGTCGKSNINDTNENDEISIEKNNHEGTDLIDKEMLEPVQQIQEITTEEVVKAPEVEHYLSDPEAPMEMEIELDPNVLGSQLNESENSPRSIEIEIEDEEVNQHEDLSRNNENFREVEQATVNEEYRDLASGMLEPQVTDEEVPVTNQYACSSCDITFNSIVEHIQMYHTGQEVMINVPGADNEVLSNLVAPPGSIDSNVAVENAKIDTPADMGRSNESQETSVVQHKEKPEPVKKREIIRHFPLFKEKTHNISNEGKVKQRVQHQSKKIFKPIENSEIKYVSREVKIEKFWEKEPAEKLVSKPVSIGKILNTGIKREVRKFPLKKDTRTSLEKLFSGNFLLKGSGGRGTRPGPYLGVNRTPEVKFIISPDQEGVDNTISVYTCSKCQKEFGNISAFERHSCTLVKIGSLLCKICNIEFANPNNMQIHMQEIHGMKLGKSRPVTCGLCDVVFTSVRALKQHEKIHYKSVELKVSLECPVCHIVCSSNRNLNQHLKIHSNSLHNNNEDQGEELRIVTDKKDSPGLIVCKVCCKIFPNNEDLRSHWKEHVSEMEDDENVIKVVLPEETSVLQQDNEAEGIQNRMNTKTHTQSHKENKDERSKYHAWLPI